MNFKYKVSKEDIIKDYKSVLNDFFLKTGSNKITRQYYRNYSKYGTAFQRFFKTFDELKKTFSIDLPEKKISKKVLVISSILPNTGLYEDFIEAMELYCKKNNGQLLLVPIKGVRNETAFDKKYFLRYGGYFCTETVFNDNLRLVNTGVTANNKNPLRSLKELGHKNYSTIVASTKQCMEMIPSINKGKTHLIYLTGTCSKPIYNKNITGTINSNNNKIGGLIVEIENDKTFYIRNIEWINGYFVDLNKAYYKDRVENIEAEALVAGDLHLSGDEDDKSLELLHKEIKLLKAKRLVIHDFCSHNTINHHEQNNWIKMAKLTNKFHSLQDEHKYTAQKFNEFVKDIKNVEFIVVKSNHDRWLHKYLGNRNWWIKDDCNAFYAHTLCGYALLGLDPFEQTMRTFLDKDINIKFLQGGETYIVADTELSLHGDIGNNGGIATLRSLELSAGKCIIGHSHQPRVGFYGMQVGTNTKMDLGYNSTGGSSWHNGNVSLYKDSHKQMLLGVNYKISIKN